MRYKGILYKKVNSTEFTENMSEDKKQRSGSFKDNDKYMRTRSGTYVRRDSVDTPHRTESASMPDFRSGLLDF